MLSTVCFTLFCDLGFVCPYALNGSSKIIASNNFFLLLFCLYVNGYSLKFFGSIYHSTWKSYTGMNPPEPLGPKNIKQYSPGVGSFINDISYRSFSYFCCLQFYSCFVCYPHCYSSVYIDLSYHKFSRRPFRNEFC